MKITSKPLALVIFVMIFGGIGLTMAFNVWQDGSSKIPGTISEGAGAGQYDPADIRGSFTFGEVITYFDIPAETLRKAFRIPAEVDIAAMPLKELVNYSPDMSPHSVSMFTAFYNGLPYTPEEEAYLSSEAAQMLVQHGKMTPEQRAYLDAHTIEEDAGLGEQQQPQATPLPATPEAAHEATEGKTVTGSTTFQDLLDWGLPRETIETVIGGKFADPAMAVRDYFSSQGLEFKSYKDLLQAELDKID